MTLSLYVLRHAKAESAAPAGKGDHERPLKRRGRRAARVVGRFLTRLGEEPDLVLCSTALRARETADAAHTAGAWSASIELRRAIYEANPERLLGEIRSCEQTRRLLLVGHEPGLSLLICELTGSEPAFPTAALARIDFEQERWDALEPRSGRLAWLVTPEALAATRARRQV